jgi:hypothetical protein
MGDFFWQFCDVPKVAIIHRMIRPNLAINKKLNEIKK